MNVMGSRDSMFLKVWTLTLPVSHTAMTSLTSEERHIFGPTAISSNGRYVVAVRLDIPAMVLYDVSAGAELFTLQILENEITCLAMFCDDNHVISGASDGTLKVWLRSERSLEELHVMKFRSRIQQVATHPNHKLFAVCLQGDVVKLRHLNNKDVDEVNIELRDSKLTSLVVGDDQLVYGTNAGKIYIWNYEDAKNPVAMLDGHAHCVQYLTIRDKYLASIGDDEQCVVLWNSRARRRLGELYIGEEKVSALTWSYDLHHIILGFHTYMVHIYDVISQNRLVSLNVYSPISLIVAKTEHICISTQEGYFGVYKLNVSESLDPSTYSDSLESKYSTSLRHSPQTSTSNEGRRSSACIML